MQLKLSDGKIIPLKVVEISGDRTQLRCRVNLPVDGKLINGGQVISNFEKPLWNITGVLTSACDVVIYGEAL